MKIAVRVLLINGFIRKNRWSSLFMKFKAWNKWKRQVWLTFWQPQEMLRSSMSKLIKWNALVCRGFMRAASFTLVVAVCPPPWGKTVCPSPRVEFSCLDGVMTLCPNLNPTALAPNLWPRICTKVRKFYQRRDDASDFCSKLSWSLCSHYITGVDVWHMLRCTKLWYIGQMSYRKIQQLQGCSSDILENRIIRCGKAWTGRDKVYKLVTTLVIIIPHFQIQYSMVLKYKVFSLIKVIVTIHIYFQSLN